MSKKTETDTVDAASITSNPEFHAHKHPLYVEAYQHIQGLRHKLTLVSGEIQETNNRLATHRAANTHRAKAEALAFGTPPPIAFGPDNLEALCSERNIIVTAIELAERRLREIEREVSLDLIAKLRPHYNRLTRRIYQASKVLAEALADEAAFAADLVDGGTRISLQRIRIGVPSREGCAYIRKESIEMNGFDPETEV